MSEKFPPETYSVDDILREVRELRRASSEEPARSVGMEDEKSGGNSFTAGKTEKIIKPESRPAKEAEPASEITPGENTPDGGKTSVSGKMTDAEIPHIRPRANVITPDEINSGFNTGKSHVFEKRRPSVITAGELNRRTEKPEKGAGNSGKEKSGDAELKNKAEMISAEKSDLDDLLNGLFDNEEKQNAEAEAKKISER